LDGGPQFWVKRLNSLVFVKHVIALANVDENLGAQIIPCLGSGASSGSGVSHKKYNFPMRNIVLTGEHSEIRSHRLSKNDQSVTFWTKIGE